MFDSDVLDFFSRTHPVVVPVVFGPAVVGLLAYGMLGARVVPLSCALLFVLGGFSWTLAEYWLHRMFFHWVPRAAWGERLHFLVHGVHHLWPSDKYRLVMPPAVSVTLFFVFLGVFYLVWGGRLVFPFHAGFVAGYMAYDLTHYYVHHCRPRSKYGRELKKHHMLHHHKDSSRRFGVSNLLWDAVFRTR
jgi:sterol desaturase/sphingolipid hydroxylase (fatty acid hydroxylase superfamily)